VKKHSNKTERTRERGRKPGQSVRAFKWGLAAAAIVAVVYAVSQMSGIAYTEKDIRVVDFSMLTHAHKTAALEAANAARCSCGCGMTLAQCVSTDSSCPIRDANVERIRAMVRDADRP